MTATTALIRRELGQLSPKMQAEVTNPEPAEGTDTRNGRCATRQGLSQVRLAQATASPDLILSILTGFSLVVTMQLQTRVDLGEEIELEVQEDQIVIRTAHSPRQG
jgi:hypothetical protein